MTNVIKYIEEILAFGDSDEWDDSKVGAFLVHNSIFDQIQKVPGVSIQNIWDYELQIGGTAYKMKLIFVNADRNGTFRIMWDLCRDAEFSFPWEENLTLYVPLSLWSLLEKFIETERLQYLIDYKTDAKGIMANNEMIRIVRFRITTFSTKQYLKKGFRNFLRDQQTTSHPMSYYCVVAFPWLQPWNLNKFDIAFENDNSTYVVIPIILECTNYLSNNIFDLVAARMAFCDCRNLQTTEFIQSAIDRAIVRALRDRKYIKNKTFDLDQYMLDKNVSVDDRINMLVVPYLLYTFQNFFEPEVTNDTSPQGYYHTIKLCETNDVVDMLKTKSNLNIKIDGQNFDGMNFKLFNDLAGFHNITEIKLDTDYELDDNMEFEAIKFLDNDIRLFLFGKNTHRFIEKFILCIQKFRFDNRLKLLLTINCELSSYLIFDNFKIFGLIFRDITITTAMLIDLSNCTKFLPEISFYSCKFENKWENWILLDNLKELVIAEIQEDNGTWESIFKFAEHMLSSTGCNELEFLQNIYVLSNHSVRLLGLKCVFDEHKTKLMLQNSSNNEIIDLFDFKCNTEPDEKWDYDFYQ